jgi:hypothetical protein
VELRWSKINEKENIIQFTLNNLKRRIRSLQALNRADKTLVSVFSEC